MKFLFKEKRLGNLHWQRDSLLGLSITLLLILLLQTTFLFFKSDKTIILPPETKQSFWVEGNQFSASYLEEQGLYFAHLLLDITESNLLMQGDILLRYVSPEYYGDFKVKLLKEHQRLKKENLSLHFSVVECEVYPKALMVDLTGDLICYVGARKVTSHRETYRIQFIKTKGRLFLKNFSVLKTDQKGEEDEADAELA